MVTILPPKPPSFGQSLLLGAAQAAPQAVENYYAKLANQKREQEAQETARKYYGLETGGFDPETRKALLAEQLRQAGNQNILEKKLQASGKELSPEDYENLKRNYGEEVADLWGLLSTGGKTAATQDVLEKKRRHHEIESSGRPQKMPESLPQIESGKLPQDFEWPDFTQPEEGYTAKEWAAERKTWRKENAPIFSEIKKLTREGQRDLLATRNLKKLNPKLPKGVEKLIINPNTGEPYAVAQLAGKVSPEVQQWSKEIARFQNRAKNTFGARVTNFDLVSYMKQFPSLMNTEEGRSRILRMMEINYELDNLYNNALKKVYDHYGLNNISQEKASELAEGFIKDRTAQLEEEYLNIDDENKEEIGEELTGEEVEVMDENGNIVGTLDISEVGELPEGYRIR